MRASSTTTSPLFPMFMKLTGRPCLVVGAGRIGEPKILSLVDCGANVSVVAPKATAGVAELAKRGAIRWRQKLFEPGDLEAVFLVVAATSAMEVNHAVYQEAQWRGVLCNVVDDRLHCDFFYPSIVRRGQFQIAISTGGLSPALAQRVRQQLEIEFPSTYGEWLESLARKREALFKKVNDPELRRSLIHQSVTPRAFERFKHHARTGVGNESSVSPGGDTRLSITGTTRKETL
jgi:precorrin-2 dehydrogenase / sirohydrochlorin ferrochelatase